MTPRLQNAWAGLALATVSTAAGEYGGRTCHPYSEAQVGKAPRRNPDRFLRAHKRTPAIGFSNRAEHAGDRCCKIRWRLSKQATVAAHGVNAPEKLQDGKRRPQVLALRVRSSRQSGRRLGWRTSGRSTENIASTFGVLDVAPRD